MVVPLVSSKYFGYSSISKTAPVSWASSSPLSAPVSWANRSSTSTNTSSSSSTVRYSSANNSTPSASSSSVSNSSTVSSSTSTTSASSSSSIGHSSAYQGSGWFGYSSMGGSSTSSSTNFTGNSLTSYPIGGHSSISTTPPVSQVNRSPSSTVLSNSGSFVGSITSSGSSSSKPVSESNYILNNWNNGSLFISPPNQYKQPILSKASSQMQAWQNMGTIMPAHDVISSILQQYGYQLTQQELQEIDNLQARQSIIIQGATPVKITYLGNNQYQIQTVGNPFTTTGQEVGLDLTITIPTYSINQQTGQVGTGSILISGTVTNSIAITSSNGIAEIFPYQTETYSVNEIIPITSTISGNQVTFQTGNPQGNITLQSTSLPTITIQQLQELESGQIPPGLKPGVYYNPQTQQIINISYQTVQQPQVSNQYSYVFYNPNVPYSTTNPSVDQYIAVNTNTDTIYFLNPYGKVLSSISFTNTQALNNYLYQNYGITLTNNGPTITASTNTQTTIPSITPSQSSASTTSLSIPTIISDIWNGLTTIGSDIYSWFTSLSKPQNNTLNLNYQQLAQEVLYSQTPTSITTSHSTTPTTQQTQILQDSFFSTQILSDIWSGIITLGNDISTVLFTNPIIKNTYDIGESVFNDIYNIGADTYRSISSINWGQVWERINQPGEITTPTGQKAEVIQFTMPAIGPADAAEFTSIIGDNGIITDIGGFLSKLISSPKVLINAAIGAGEYIGSGEAMSYLTTGKPLPTQQVLELAEIGAITGGIAGGFSLFSESANSILASIGKQFTSLNFAKNLGLNIGGSLISSNIYDYVTSGQLPTLKQNIQSIEEAGPATLAFSGIAGILESPNIANSFLKLVTSENSNKYWPIAARILYDMGANALAGFGSSLTAQGIGNLIGAQKGINLEEAGMSALFAAGLTGLTEGIYAFRNPGGFVKSFGYYPLKYDSLDIAPTRVDLNNMIVQVEGEGNEILYPRLGNRFYTEQDFGNIKPLNMPFDITGYIQAIMGGETEGEEETQGLNTIKYTGRFKITSGKNTVITTPQGFIQLTGMPIETIDQYFANAQFLVNELASLRPEFSELANVPWQGTYLFAKTTEGNLPEVVEGLNKGQTIAQIENGNTYYSGELETFISPSSWNKNIGPFPNPTYLDWRVPLSYLQTGEYRYFFVRPTYLLSETSEELEEPGAYLIYKYKVPTGFNANNPNRMVVWREQGIIPTSLGQTYKGYSYGISANYETGEEEGTYVSSISTSAGILKEQGSNKYWAVASQGGTVTMRDSLLRTPEGELQNIQIGFGYTKGIDPNQEYQKALQMLQNAQQSIQQSGSNLEISPNQIVSILQGVAKQKMVMPVQSYGTIRPYTNYGFSIIGTNQNAINVNNNYNIGMSRIPNTVQQISQEYIQTQTNYEKPIFNEFNIQNNLINMQFTNERYNLDEFNIQNELSTIRENLNEEISNISGWSNQIQVPVPQTKPLKNYGKNLYNGIQNPESQENSIKSSIKPLNLGKNLLRENEKGKSLKRNEDSIQMLLPEFGLLAAGIYREETTKPLIITITTTGLKTKPISPPPTKPKPKTPTPPIPPTNPPREFPPFGFPEISIMGQSIRGLGPEFGRGVRSMFDIQYALSRITL